MADRGDETVAMILACVSSWAQAADRRARPGPDDRPRRAVAVAARSPPWSARSTPTCGCRAPRAPSRCWPPTGSADFETAGVAGSAESAIATGLIASCDTRICLRQDTAPLAATREQIGLTDTECAHIASWSGQQIGRAVWKVGRAASAVVQLVLTPAERQLFWTNERMGDLMRGDRAATWRRADNARLTPILVGLLDRRRRQHRDVADRAARRAAVPRPAGRR